MGLDRMVVIFKLVACRKLDAITLFQAVSGFKKPNHGSRWDGSNFQTGNFCHDIINFSKQFHILRTVKSPINGSGWNKHDLPISSFG